MSRPNFGVSAQLILQYLEGIKIKWDVKYCFVIGNETQTFSKYRMFCNEDDPYIFDLILYEVMQTLDFLHFY